MCLSAWATQSQSSPEIEKLKLQWQNEQQNIYRQFEKQRVNFLLLETLLREMEREGKFSNAIFERVVHLEAMLLDYPLIEEIKWAILNTKLKLNAISQEEILHFIKQYPHIAKRNKLEQFPIEMWYKQQKWSELLAYSDKVGELSVANQCRVWAVQYQSQADKLQLNPEAAQANNLAQPLSPELAQLLAKFDDFWINNGSLPSDCANLEAFWRDQGLKTEDKVKQKAVKLWITNAKAELSQLALNNQDVELGKWLADLQKLLLSRIICNILLRNNRLTISINSLYCTLSPNFSKHCLNKCKMWILPHIKLGQSSGNLAKIKYVNGKSSFYNAFLITQHPSSSSGEMHS